MSKKKKEAPANDGPKKESFERRSFRFVLKLIGYMFFIFYLIWSVPQTQVWANILWVQSQPIERLAELAKEQLQTGHPEKIQEWVKMRPYGDIDRIMEILEPYTAKLSPLTFTLYAHRLAQRGDLEEAAFWHYFSLYRLRFDALRCGRTEDAIGLTEFITKISRNESIEKAIKNSPRPLTANIRAVLDKDAMYPAHNNPDSLCQTLQKMTRETSPAAPEQEWALIRHMLRNKSEADLAALEARMQLQKQKDLIPDTAPEEEPPKTEQETEDNKTTETP